MITIVNPSSEPDTDTIEHLHRLEARVEYIPNLSEIKSVLLDPSSRRHFVVTSVADNGELVRVLSALDRDSSVDYVVLVGPQAMNDRTLESFTTGNSFAGRDLVRL